MILKYKYRLKEIAHVNFCKSIEILKHPCGVRAFVNVNPRNLNGKDEFEKQSKSLGRYALF